jgi:hypothetical protein
MAKTAAMKEKKNSRPRATRKKMGTRKKKTDPVLLAGSRLVPIPQSTSATPDPIDVGSVLTGPDGTTYMVTALEPTGSVVFGRYNSPAPCADPLGDTAEVLKGVGTDGTDGTESSYYHAHLARIANDPLPELTGDDILSCLEGV